MKGRAAHAPLAPLPICHSHEHRERQRVLPPGPRPPAVSRTLRYRLPPLPWSGFLFFSFSIKAFQSSFFFFFPLFKE